MENISLFNNALTYINAVKTKSFDAYDLAYAVMGKSVMAMGKDELETFIALLQKLETSQVIRIKMSAGKGEKLFNGIDRKIIINKTFFVSADEVRSLYLYRQDLGFDSSYYHKNPRKYKEHAIYIQRLAEYLETRPEGLTTNEISYLIFQDEKALSERTGVDGINILSNLKLTLSNLYAKDAVTPFYYETNIQGNTILIVENKDTCYTMFRLCKKWQNNIRGVLYGEGRAVLKKMAFLDIYGIENVAAYIYFGDIDREGFDIYQSLKIANPHLPLGLSKVLYSKLAAFPARPAGSERRLNYNHALAELELATRNVIEDILSKNLFIPQEALHYAYAKELLYGHRLY